MATTQKKMDQEHADYQAAYEGRAEPVAGEGATTNTGAAPAVATQESEPQAAPVDIVGATSEQPVGETGELSGPSEELSVAEPTNGSEPAGAESAEPAATDTGAPMNEQQLRSWQGRLKKLEAELKARAEEIGKPTEEVAGDVLEDVAEEAAPEGDGVDAASVEEVAEQVESGEMTPQQAIAALAEDFGEPFIKMIELIARNAAETKVGDVAKTVDEIIEDIVESRAKSHFDAIRAAKADYEEVVNSEEFKAWATSQEGDQKAETMRILEAGSAQEIIALLQSYSDSTATAAPAEESAPESQPPAAAPAASEEAEDDGAAMMDDPAMDAAEGVRSSGMQLPAEPAAATDYEKAWNQA